MRVQMYGALAVTPSTQINSPFFQFSRFNFDSDVLYDPENEFENELLASMDLEDASAGNATNNSMKNQGFLPRVFRSC